jgi:hypothetical protein
VYELEGSSDTRRRETGNRCPVRVAADEPSARPDAMGISSLALSSVVEIIAFCEFSLGSDFLGNNMIQLRQHIILEKQ